MVRGLRWSGHYRDEKYTEHQKNHICNYRNIFTHLFLAVQLPILKGQQDKSGKLPCSHE